MQPHNRIWYPDREATGSRQVEPCSVCWEGSTIAKDAVIAELEDEPVSETKLLGVSHSKDVRE